MPIYTQETMKNPIFSSPPNFDMAQTWSTSDAVTPLIFILSVGSDPMLQIQNFVREQNMWDKFSTLALGQGQGEKAQKLLDRAVREGNWVCL